MLGINYASGKHVRLMGDTFTPFYDQADRMAETPRARMTVSNTETTAPAQDPSRGVQDADNLNQQQLLTPNEKSSGTRDTSAVTSAAASATLRSPRRRTWYQNIGAGIFLDLRARAPWYWSDWADAWNYRVVPATALIFFAK